MIDRLDIKTELSDEDRAHIREVFDVEMVPKLKKSHARLGMLNCDFAGEQYKHWNIQCIPFLRSIESDRCDLLVYFDSHS